MNKKYRTRLVGSNFSNLKSFNYSLQINIPDWPILPIHQYKINYNVLVFEQIWKFIQYSYMYSVPTKL